MADAANPSSTLLVFSDDWGRHPSSCQHLIRRLLPRHRVLWVNTIATRPPRLDWSTTQRGIEKIRDWLGPQPQGDSLPENLTVLNPVMWPWMTSARDRAFNRWALVTQLAARLRTENREVVAVSTLPIVADLPDRLPVARWVYYCVDDLSQWPGLDRPALESMERDVVDRADVLIAASEELLDRLSVKGRCAALLTHGVDLEHWKTNCHAAADPLLDSCERPLIVFWGLIDGRMDFDFVSRLSRDLDRGTILLAGPASHADPAIFHLPRVRRMPPMAYSGLPLLAREASVLIMPYVDAPVTRAMQPLKLLEYLATDKPVVVRDLPAVRAWSDCLDIARTPDEFSQAVRMRIQSGPNQVQTSARGRLAQESWSAKSDEFERLILAPGTERS